MELASNLLSMIPILFPMLPVAVAGYHLVKAYMYYSLGQRQGAIFELEQAVNIFLALILILTINLVANSLIPMLSIDMEAEELRIKVSPPELSYQFLVGTIDLSKLFNSSAQRFSSSAQYCVDSVITLSSIEVALNMLGGFGEILRAASFHFHWAMSAATTIFLAMKFLCIVMMYIAPIFMALGPILFVSGRFRTLGASMIAMMLVYPATCYFLSHIAYQTTQWLRANHYIPRLSFEWGEIAGLAAKITNIAAEASWNANYIMLPTVATIVGMGLATALTTALSIILRGVSITIRII